VWKNLTGVWCGDITFIRTAKGWLYLAVVLDLYARKVVGWAFSRMADRQVVQDALTMVWDSRGRPSGVQAAQGRGMQRGRPGPLCSVAAPAS